jgi:hypothetical protein
MNSIGLQGVPRMSTIMLKISCEKSICNAVLIRLQIWFESMIQESKRLKCGVRSCYYLARIYSSTIHLVLNVENSICMDHEQGKDDRPWESLLTAPTQRHMGFSQHSKDIQTPPNPHAGS